MEDPIQQLRTTTANGEVAELGFSSETIVEEGVTDEAAEDTAGPLEVDASAGISEEAEIKKTAGPVIIALEKVTAPADNGRASVEDIVAEDRAESPEPENDEGSPLRTENVEEDVHVEPVKRVIECSKCHATESLFWRTASGGELLCVACQGSTEIETKEDVDEDLSQAGSDPPTTPSGSDHNEEAEYLADQDDAPQKTPSPRKRELRKATRLKTAKYVKSGNKSRRSLMFKKSAPAKTTPSVSHFITSNYVRHKGSYLQRGDIVSMLGEDSEIYYAQLRTFLVDQFGQLSATISWLIPTERSPSDGSFDPATFVLGPEEDFPRDLRSMSYECRAPSDYYLARDRPILFDERKGCKAFVWTTLGRPKAIYESPEAQ